MVMKTVLLLVVLLAAGMVTAIGSPLLLAVNEPATSTTASTMAISGSVAGGTGTVTVQWITDQGSSGTAQGSANWTAAPVALAVGSNVITITARDAIGSQVSQAFTVTRQAANAPPDLTIVSPAATTLATGSSTIVVSGTAQSSVGLASVTWTNSAGGSGSANGAADWSTPPIPLLEGFNAITITAADSAGNTSWRSVTVTRK
jgi:hypothetical protein